MKEYLDLDNNIEEITIIKSGEGKIKINNIIPEFKNGKWIGKYLFDISITITTIPSEKSKFKAWIENLNFLTFEFLFDFMFFHFILLLDVYVQLK